MGIEVALWAGAIAAAGAAASSNYQANKQARAEERAMRKQEEQARKTAESAREAERRQNAQQADITGILSQNQDALLSGGSTLLTGAQGIQNDQLNLGKGNTLG